jgi:hypothetical protein
MKAHPRSAFGAQCSRQRRAHQRPGKAGSAVARALAARFQMLRMARIAVEK